MYPERSTTLSNVPDSCWYVYQGRNQAPLVCSTDGWNLLKDLQDILRGILDRHGGRLDTIGGTITTDQIQTDGVGGWTVDLLRGIAAAAQQCQVYARVAGVSDALESDIRTRRISPATLRVAIWLAQQSTGVDDNANIVYCYGSPTEVRLPPDIIRPVIGYELRRPAEVIEGHTCHPAAYWMDRQAQRTRIHPGAVVGGVGVLGIVAAAIL